MTDTSVQPKPVVPQPAAHPAAGQPNPNNPNPNSPNPNPNSPDPNNPNAPGRRSTDPVPPQKESLGNLRRGIEIMKTHQAAKVAGSIYTESLEYLEAAYRGFSGSVK